MRSSSVESAIIELLESEDYHLTAKEILEKIRPRLPAVNPSTVYRALERLSLNGTISVSDIGRGALVFERIESETHHHMVCRHCGKLIHLNNGIVEKFFTEIAEHSGYLIATNHLVLFGVCAGCQDFAEQ